MSIAASWFTKPRQVGLAAMLGVLLVQVAYAISSQACAVASLLEAGAICLVPSAAFLATRAPVSAAAASITLLPFLVWANNAECLWPAVGGGAPMAYVAVFMFGLPASLVVGLAFLAIAALLRGKVAHHRTGG